MRAFRVLMILPPDVHAPEIQRHHRFPPQGPAIVAASVAPEGFSMRVADLELSVYERPLDTPLTELDWAERVDAMLRDRGTPTLEALADELIDRLGSADEIPDAYAFSLDRHTQANVAALLARRLKQRTGRPVIIGGAGASACRALFQRTGATGVDVITNASTPEEIRAAFRPLRDLPLGHVAAPVEAGGLLRLGRREAQDSAWPMPDYGIYDLELYRRDPIAAEAHRFNRYDGSLGRGLILPYSFTYECQFSCAFCQTDGRQSHKDVNLVAREMATLAECHGVSEFVMFDAQINLVAGAFARALIDAKVSLRWSNSYRVRPTSPEELDVMRESGCVALTVGVESTADAVLKKMVKGHQQRHADDLMRWCSEREIMTRVNLLPCFPGETRADLEVTRDWVERHADAIDDLAPSSFYLTAESPIGRNPERYGIALRGERRLDGEYRFRKQFDSLAYDEIGGLTWEEREPLLRQAERMMMDAWSRGAPDRAAVRGLRPDVMLAMRARYSTRDAAYEALTSWAATESRPAPAGAVVAARPRVVFPRPCDAVLSGRFERVIDDADESLRRFMGPRPAGLMLLLGSGDYLIVRGTLDLDETTQLPSRLSVRDIVARRMADTRRRRLYGRLAPGAVIEVNDTTLTSRADESPWEEPIAYGDDFIVLEFDAR